MLFFDDPLNGTVTGDHPWFDGSQTAELLSPYPYFGGRISVPVGSAERRLS